MEQKYKHIIWGASIKGIEKAIALKDLGEKALVLNKLGFPGGKYTESLACYISRKSFHEEFLGLKIGEALKNVKYGIIYEDSDRYLLHPEAIKRICWDLIRLHDLEILFHVTPLEIIHESSFVRLKLFGREGEITIISEHFHDFSDDNFFNSGLPGRRNKVCNMRINCFFRQINENLVNDVGIKYTIPCDLGYYVCIEEPCQIPENIELQFNKMLDNLTRNAWEKYNSRILMLPTFPELIPIDYKDERYF